MVPCLAISLKELYREQFFYIPGNLEVYGWADVIIITPNNVIPGRVRHIVLQTVRIGVGQDLFQLGVGIIKPYFRLDEGKYRTKGEGKSSGYMDLRMTLLELLDLDSRTTFSPSRDDSGLASINGV